MNKKIILFLSVVLIAIFAVSSVSAFEFNFLSDSNEPTNVTIDGVVFSIPDGFVEDPDEATDNVENQQGAITYKTNGKLYEKDDTYVALLVADYGEYKVTDEIVKTTGGTAKKIKGISGYLADDGTYTTFSYPENDKLVVISSNDKDIIGEFIIGE